MLFVIFAFILSYLSEFIARIFLALFPSVSVFPAVIPSLLLYFHVCDRLYLLIVEIFLDFGMAALDAVHSTRPFVASHPGCGVIPLVHF